MYRLFLLSLPFSDLLLEHDDNPRNISLSLFSLTYSNTSYYHCKMIAPFEEGSQGCVHALCHLHHHCHQQRKREKEKKMPLIFFHQN